VHLALRIFALDKVSELVERPLPEHAEAISEFLSGCYFELGLGTLISIGAIPMVRAKAMAITTNFSLFMVEDSVLIYEDYVDKYYNFSPSFWI
jgi:hypothetical protein